nr:hypothetical protein [Tanacetum cinerariifolium]
EPDYGRIQSLPEVQGKGKEKLIDEHVAHTLLDLNTPKKKSVADHETESDEIVTPVNKEKDASNRRLTEINAEVQDKGHAGSNPGKQDEGQTGSNPEEPEKTNAKLEVQSMVTVLIHQDTSSVPPMTIPVIDLTTLQSDSPTVHASLPTSTTTTTTITTTTTTLPPPPPQPQQSTTDMILLQRIGELDQHMANSIQYK